MSYPAVDIVTATPDLLDQAADASEETFKRQNNPFRRWTREIMYGCATCAPIGFAAHLATCVVFPAALAGGLSNALYLDKGNLAETILYHAPRSALTAKVIAPLLSFDVSDTVLRTALTAGLAYGAYRLLRWKRKLKDMAPSVQIFNAGLFVSGTLISASFNVGSFIADKEAYHQWAIETTAEDRARLGQVAAQPYVSNEFLSWMGFQGHSCIAPRKPGQSLGSFVGTSVYEAAATTGTGATAPFNGRLIKALEL